MKKLFIILAVFLSGLIFVPQYTFAVEGTCAWHGGVNCGAGPDWDTSAICNDGWTKSGERYFQQALCQSSFACMANQWQQQSQSPEMVNDQAHILSTHKEKAHAGDKTP